MRKRWIIISVAAGLLALAITGGAIFAQGPGGKWGHSDEANIGRMAELLNVEESQVQDAFRQVRRENQDESLQLTLDRLVEGEAMEQDQADAIMEWYQQRPDDIPPGLLGRGFGGRGFHGRGHGGQMRAHALQPAYTAPANSQ
jgi:hypothetical protein